jgi:shikimate dehydrogenase
MIYTALIGYPTEQSLSNRLFQIYADSVPVEYAHLKINVDPKASLIQQTVNSLRVLQFSGFNVTIPYKMEILKLLDNVDAFSKEIGAVNTVRIQDDKLYGFNTDYIGAVISIENALNRKVALEDEVIVFGTGGAAKAIVGGLLNYTKKITVFYREPKSERTIDFIMKFSGKIDNILPTNASMIKSKLLTATIICNGTPVGMSPKISETVLPFNIRELRENLKERVFFDAVYNPLHTTFLKSAMEEKYLVADGLDMMIYQGVAAFKIWTSFDVSPSTIKNTRRLMLEV